MKDMVEIKSGKFLDDLKTLKELCEKHIKIDCEVSFFYDFHF